MITKLRKLEAKLSYIDVEDLYTLSSYSSDALFIKHLQKFIAQYAEFFNITEIFRDNSSRKQFFIIVLIQKLFECVEWMKHSPELVSGNSRDFAIKRKVIFNICEALRICFRESPDFLNILQSCQLFSSLLFIISQRNGFFRNIHKLVLSAFKVMVNALNKSSDRTNIFLLHHERSRQEPYSMLAAANPIARFVDVIYNNPDFSALDASLVATSEEKASSGGESSSKSSRAAKDTDSEKLSASPAESKGKGSGSSGGETKGEKKAAEGKEADSFADLEVIDSKETFDEGDELTDLLGEDLDQPSPPGASSHEVQFLNYAVKILYMISCQSEEARDFLKERDDLLRALLHRLTRCLTDPRHTRRDHPPAHEPDASPHLSGKDTVKMIDFPHNNDNFTLFSTICRLLYLLDVYARLERRPLPVLVDKSLVEFFAAENQTNWTKKLDEIESVDDIHLVLRGRSSDNTSFRSARSNETSVSFHQPAAPSAASAGPSNFLRDVRNPRCYDVVNALELLNFLTVIVLTIGPYDWTLYITPDHDLSSVFYTGNLVHCEECVLQLLMLSSDDNIAAIFNSTPIGILQQQQAQVSGVPRLAPLEIITHHRRLFLANSLVRILTTVLQKVKNMDLAEKAAALCPIVIAAMKVSRADERSLQIMRRLIFPNPVTPDPAPAPVPEKQQLFASTSQKQLAGPSSQGAAKDKDKHMHPADCPDNSIRAALIGLMTSIETNIKRCVAEFIFLLCHENKDEFVHRTGLGNSIALLQIKGLF